MSERERTPARRHLGGFTLVELLVTIAIIGILVSLLIPAVAAVRRTTKEAACKATLHALETGLETFKADAKLGGMYPPSYSDANPDLANNPPRGMVISPYTDSAEQIPMSGAGLLVWALSGADLLGTPGFQPFGGASTWAASSGGAPGAGGAYELDPGKNYQAVHPRYGPYVDGSKVPVTRRSPGNVPYFAVPEEEKVVEALHEITRVRPFPMYLDPFGFPVLYWRADPAGRQMANHPRVGHLRDRGIYWWEDNGDLLNLMAGDTQVLLLNKARDPREPHELNWTQGGTSGGDLYWNHSPSDDLTDSTPFARYIRDENIRAKFQPQRPDSYLLVTAGPDGVYGTGDDIANFEHNGQ